MLKILRELLLIVIFVIITVAITAFVWDGLVYLMAGAYCSVIAQRIVG